MVLTKVTEFSSETPTPVPYEDGNLRTNHVKSGCASRGLRNSDTIRPKQGTIERLQRSDNNALTEDDVLWFTR